MDVKAQRDPQLADKPESPSRADGGKEIVLHRQSLLHLLYLFARSNKRNAVRQGSTSNPLGVLTASAHFCWVMDADRIIAVISSAWEPKSCAMNPGNQEAI